MSKGDLPEKLDSCIYHLFVEYLSFQILSNWQAGAISVFPSIVKLTLKLYGGTQQLRTESDDDGLPIG